MALSGVGDQWITVLIKDATNLDYQRVPIIGIIGFSSVKLHCRNYRVYMVTDKLSGSFGGTAREPMSTESTGDTASY